MEKELPALYQEKMKKVWIKILDNISIKNLFKPMIDKKLKIDIMRLRAFILGLSPG